MNDSYSILIIEDDPDLNQTIGYALEKAGYGVFRADSIRKAETIFVREKICLVLLDVNLPDGEGYTFCRWAKAQREVPVIYLTARDLEEDALEGYESGAEDYVTKPFSMKILLKKLDVVLKRLTPAGSLAFQDDHLRMDLEQARLYVDGRECSVTPTEVRMLRLFLSNRGQLLTYEVMLDRLWDSGGQFVDKHALAVNVNRLRQKLEDAEHKYISNVYGVGYQWIG